MPSDRVTAAATELYGADPGAFTARRKELADEARAAGDRDAAKRITALRKPTRAAWAVNRLARADPGAPERLATLASGLRAAAEEADGRKLRELSARRTELIDDLAGQALNAAGVEDPPAGLREDIAATLTAALGDPATAEGFASGTLTRASEWAGFGAFTPPDETETGGSGGAVTAARQRHHARTPSQARDSGKDAARGRQAEAPSRARQGGKSAARGQKTETPSRAREGDERAARGQKTKPLSRAREGDERAARRQKTIDDAERSVATATQAATAAVAEEDRLEATVRDLEERLTKARAELAASRTRARRAESAERKARQRLDRLNHP